MRQEGLEGNYLDVNHFLDKPLVPYKNFLHQHVNQIFHPITGKIHRTNKKAVQQVIKHSHFLFINFLVADQDPLLARSIRS